MGHAPAGPLSEPAVAALAHGGDPLADRVETFFSRHFALRPVDATFVGVHDHDGRMPDWSPAGTEALRGACDSLRREVAVREPAASPRPPSTRAAATPAGAGAARTALPAPGPRSWPEIDAALIDSYLEIQQGELESHHFTRGNPSLVVGEVAFGVVGLVTRGYAPASVRATRLAQRLQAVPAFLDGALASLRETALPHLWTRRALRECAATLRLLREGLPLWCSRASLDARAANAVNEAIPGAAGALGAFSDQLSALPAAAAVRTAGEGFVDLLLQRGHLCAQSFDQLLGAAHSAFDREKAKLAAMSTPAGLSGVFARLATLHPTPESYYQTFGETWTACRDAAQAHDLVTWPDAPVRYGPIPEWTAMAAPSLYYLYYRSPSPFDPRGVHDYVVPPIEALSGDALATHLKAWNHSVVKLNHVIHHGALGHHVQNWYAARSPSRVGQIAATDCASRIAMFCGGTMAEGWACYATDLMEEAGFLTPDERVAEQQTRVRLLARAVVDLELHSGRRTFDDAVALYVSQAGMLPDAAHGEVVKNSMFPGTAVMYWLGTQGIHELRAEVQRRRGPGFSLRRFHDELLSFGSLPVSLVAELMRDDHVVAS